MTTRRFLIAGVVLVALSVGVTWNANASTSTRVPTGLPSGPCDPDHQWDIEIIDGALFECDCSHMMFGPPICDWFEITSQAEDPVRFRRFVKRAKAKHRHVVTRVAPTVPRLVAVVTPAATVAAPAASRCNDPYLADDAWAQVHGC